MIVCRAPLRIPLGGGGTDFPSYYKKYGGFICGFALGKYATVIIHDTLDKKIRLKYSKTEIVDEPDQLDNKIAGEALKWYGYPKAFQSGIEIVTFSDAPEASGLGGSSSFCVALVAALRRYLKLPHDKDTIFASAYDIERNKAGQPGGMQDQFFATYGGAWSLQIGDEVVKTPLGISTLVSNLKLLYTGTGRLNLDIAKNQTTKTNSLDQTMVNNLDLVKAMGKTIATYIKEGREEEVGKLFGRHWEIKKKRDPNVTNPTVDELYQKALGQGAVGGKLIGLGGGGYLLMYTNGHKSDLPYIPVNVDHRGVEICYEG
jgi:D-glycero-alpha-D-manno-heptose-7-phosphate kinase